MTELSKFSLLSGRDTKEKITGYWTKRADGFADLRQAELHSNKYGRWEKELVGQLPSGQTLQILDVGCGAGFFSILLARLGHQVTAVDLTAKMIEGAQKLAAQELEVKFELAAEQETEPALTAEAVLKEKLDGNLKQEVPKNFAAASARPDGSATFLVMDAEKLNFPSAHFDVVLSRNLTWNLPHPAAAYAEWLRVLKPGGLLLNYDGEYAKDHHRHIGDNAHAGIAPALLQECHQIYHLLEISLADRPDWDEQVLKGLGCARVDIARNVGQSIYREKDEFNISTPMFRIKAVRPSDLRLDL
jgi:ubiquinone/menaquinone biosynthesis C-methylase UbiE